MVVRLLYKIKKEEKEKERVCRLKIIVLGLLLLIGLGLGLGLALGAWRLAGADLGLGARSSVPGAFWVFTHNIMCHQFYSMTVICYFRWMDYHYHYRFTVRPSSSNSNSHSKYTHIILAYFSNSTQPTTHLLSTD